MVSVRWLRPPRVMTGTSAPPGTMGAQEVDPWLDTIHRLAQGRAAERRRLVPTGDATRARLREPR
jgi:hypothetical protein